MPHLNKLITAGALAALMVATPAVSDEADTGPRIVELPIQAPLYIRETASGDTVIVSADGRFVLPGKMVDRKETYTVISSIEKAEEMFGKKPQEVAPAGSQSNSSLINDEGFPDVDQLLSFSVGTGEKVAYVWVDPLCPYCHRVVEMQEELADEYTFHNLIVPLLSARSERAVDALSCMKEEDRQGAMQSNNYANTSAECNEAELANSQRLATQMQVEAVPTIISPNRQSVTGAPSTVQQFKMFLDGGL